jgi:hypothetical protein
MATEDPLEADPIQYFPMKKNKALNYLNIE